jgi:hypothetical protein
MMAGTSATEREKAASASGAVRRDGVTRTAARSYELGEPSAKLCGILGTEAERATDTAKEHCDARFGQIRDGGAKPLCRLGKARGGDTMHRASGGDDIRRLQIVVGRRGDEVEQRRRQLRIQDMEAVGRRGPLHRERDRRAVPPGGDDEPRPGGRQGLGRDDRPQQPSRRQIDM